MNEWFIQHADTSTETGPLRPSELLEHVRKGTVTPQTKLRKGSSAWFSASEVGGLFKAAAAPEIRHLCPSCQRPVPPPPCTCKHCSMDLHHTIQQKVARKSVVTADAATPVKKSLTSWLKRKKIGDQDR